MGWGLIGAIGGLGKGMADIADTNMKQQNELDLAQARADIEMQKAQTLAQFNQQLQEDAAQRAGQRFTSAQTGLLNSSIMDNAKKFYGDDVPGSIDDLTDEEKAQFAATSDQKNQAMINAGLQSGTISPKEAAAFLQKGEMSEAQARMMMQRQDDLNRYRQDKLADTMEIARLKSEGSGRKGAFTDSQLQSAQDRLSKHIESSFKSPDGTVSIGVTSLVGGIFNSAINDFGSIDKANVVTLEAMAAGDKYAKANKLSPGLPGYEDALRTGAAMYLKALNAKKQSAQNGSPAQPVSSEAKPAPATPSKPSIAGDGYDYSPSNLPEGMKAGPNGFFFYDGNMYPSFEKAMKAYSSKVSSEDRRREFIARGKDELLKASQEYDGLF